MAEVKVVKVYTDGLTRMELRSGQARTQQVSLSQEPVQQQGDQFLKVGEAVRLSDKLIGRESYNRYPAFAYVLGFSEDKSQVWLAMRPSAPRYIRGEHELEAFSFSTCDLSADEYCGVAFPLNQVVKLQSPY